MEGLAVPNSSEPTRWGNVRRHLLSAAATAAVGILVILLLQPQKSEPQTPRDADNEQTAPVHVAGHGVIDILPDTPLARKLATATVSTENLSTPLFSSTGEIVARLAVGAGTVRGANPPAAGRADDEAEMPAWTFGSPDLFSTYNSWIQSRRDAKFTADEVEKIRILDQAKVDDLQKTAGRLKELVKAGSDAPKDLQAAESDLLQARLQMEKDVYEAQKAMKDAEKTRDDLTRQLIDADAPPDLLQSAKEGTVIVAADVPESRVTLIREGAVCTARFYGLPDVTFSGKAAKLGTILSKDRRTLRVLFVIDDPQNRLRSNMFAEVGLGADSRSALTVPMDAVLHEGEADYVLVAAADNSYRAAAVEVGDPVADTRIEVLKGLQPGAKILSSGVILLKPYVVQSLEEVN